MALAFPRDAVRELLATLSGIPVSRVRWKEESEKATLSIDGKAGKITLNLVAMREGGPEARRAYDAGANKVTEQWGSTEDVTISVRADNFIGLGKAYDLLRKVRFTIAQPVALAALRAVGLAYVESPSIVSLDYSSDNRAVSSASLDIRVASLMTGAIVEVPFIEKATSKAGPFTAGEAAALPVADVKITRP